jgi:hypothetical protein
MDFSTGVSVTEEAPRGGWDWVAHVVHPREVGDMGIKEGSPSLISDTRCPKRDTSDLCSRRQSKLQEQGIEFCKGSPK